MNKRNLLPNLNFNPKFPLKEKKQRQMLKHSVGIEISSIKNKYEIIRKCIWVTPGLVSVAGKTPLEKWHLNDDLYWFLVWNANNHRCFF